jgi:hypothetical protein
MPFMSIGAADNRGNGGVLGYMNDSNSASWVTWTSTIFDIYESAPPVALGTSETPNEVSLIADRMRLSCKQSAECWQENKQYIDGRLRDRPENPNKFVGTFYDIPNSVNKSK